MWPQSWACRAVTSTGCSSPAPGRTVADHYRLIRLARARKLIKATDMDLASIAQRCGFVSYSHFLRRYREAFALSPARDRAAVDTARSAPARMSPLADLHPFQAQLDPVRLI